VFHGATCWVQGFPLTALPAGHGQYYSHAPRLFLRTAERATAHPSDDRRTTVKLGLEVHGDVCGFGCGPGPVGCGFPCRGDRHGGVGDPRRPRGDSTGTSRSAVVSRTPPEPPVLHSSPHLVHFALAACVDRKSKVLSLASRASV
jgi:hypothetical protein